MTPLTPAPIGPPWLATGRGEGTPSPAGGACGPSPTALAPLPLALSSQPPGADSQGPELGHVVEAGHGDGGDVVVVQGPDRETRVR